MVRDTIRLLLLRVRIDLYEARPWIHPSGVASFFMACAERGRDQSPLPSAGNSEFCESQEATGTNFSAGATGSACF